MLSKLRQNLGKYLCLAAVGGATAVAAGCSTPETAAEVSSPANEKSRLAAIKKYLNGQGKVESIEKIRVNDADLLLIRYVLTPTPQSYIRCAMALPAPEVWSGRFIGVGNCGFPTGYADNFYNWKEFVPSTGCTEHLAGKNNAIVTSDMGFSRHRTKNPEVWKDFGFRSTHLMTVSAKKIIELYYGKKADYSYFFGLSTGGGQALHEVQKFPEDYDGLIAVVPASTRLYLLASNLHVYRSLHDKNGKKLFTNKHLAIIRRAAVRYFADKSPEYAAGRFVADARHTPEAAAKIARIAGEMDKSFTPDMIKRVEQLFGPVYLGKNYAGHSVPPGGADLYNVGNAPFAMLNIFYGDNFDLTKVDIDRDLEDIFREMGPIFNAENPDLSEFRKRNGKLIVCSGGEDCIVPYAGFWDYYLQAAEAAGGVDELKKNVLYYLLPGRSHVRGSGARMLKDVDKVLFDWVEKGITPQAINGVTAIGKEFPVQPYPMMTVGSEKQGYSTIPFPAMKHQKRDELFTLTMSAAEARKECCSPNQKITYPAGSKVWKWQGYTRYDFTFEGRKCFIAAPAKAAPGMPWLWCLQWPTAFIKRTPTFGLLDKGYHYVYIDLHDTRMGIEGVKIARRFYDMLQTLSFAPKAALSGLSIGGLYALRWASEYPQTVSSIYLDAPMTEPVSRKSWALKVFEKNYGLKGVEALRNSPLSPNNSCAVLARAKIPVIAIRHGEDQTVPNKNHFDLWSKRFRAAGGDLTVINHKLYGHHPHGLDDPKRLTEFILRHER